MPFGHLGFRVVRCATMGTSLVRVCKHRGRGNLEAKAVLADSNQSSACPF